MKVKLFFCISFVSIFLYSCQKETIEKEADHQDELELENKYNWQISEDDVLGWRTQLNSYTDSSNLYIMGFDYFSVLRAKEIDSSDVEIHHFPILLPPDRIYKLPINSKVFVIAGYPEIEDLQLVSIVPTQNPYPWDNYFIIDMKNMDSGFENLLMPHNDMGEGVVLNNNQCLIPYQKTDPQESNSSQLNFLLVNFQIEGIDNNDNVDTLSSKIISLEQKLNNDPQNIELKSIHSIEDNFYITTSKETFKLSPNHDVNQILDQPLYKLLKQDDIIFGFSPVGLYSSLDNGESWQFISEAYSDLWKLNYKLINNEIIGFHLDQLYHFILNNDNLVMKELTNNGLNIGNRSVNITSVSHFKDQVYITTSSGLFQKNISEFFTYKGK